ncbi:MAG: sulfatase-like hydrolase/transferase [Candidatus Firestonebacteria bacterium]|nr:sulfatase-like hydrolase/transferase [Candidatus Firestonebacteria bacterium]
MQRKNVILITSDQFRWDTLSCNGSKDVKTPGFDRMAKEGITFTNAMSSNPICVPARATMTTGNHSHKCTGRKENAGRIKDDQLKIAEYFNSYGYETYKYGKFHYVPYQKDRIVHGFKHWEMTESGRLVNQEVKTGKDLGGEDYFKYLESVGYPNMARAHGIGNNDVHAGLSALPLEHFVDCWILKRTLENLKKHLKEKQDKPFFLWMSFPKPHSPYDPPEPYHKMYDPRKISKPAGKYEMLFDKNPELRLRQRRYGMNFFSEQGVQLSRARYFGLVSLQDKLVGELLKFLKENGLAKSTSLLFAADHGDLLGDFGIFFKSCFLNGSVRVPFLISSPFLKKNGMKSKDLVGLEDVFPTLCDLAGLPAPQNIDGRSVISQDLPKREVYISQCNETPNQLYMAFDGRYKYCYAECEGTEELYDQKNDIKEIHNLAKSKKHAKIVKYLRNCVIDWCKNNQDTMMLDKKGKLKKSVLKEIDEELTYKDFTSYLGWRKY